MITEAIGVVKEFRYRLPTFHEHCCIAAYRDG